MSEERIYAFKDALNGDIHNTILVKGTEAYRKYLNKQYAFFRFECNSETPAGRTMQDFVSDYFELNYKDDSEQKVLKADGGLELLPIYQDFIEKVIKFYKQFEIENTAPTADKLSPREVSHIASDRLELVDKSFFDPPYDLNESHHNLLGVIIDDLNSNFTIGLERHQFVNFLSNIYIRENPLIKFQSKNKLLVFCRYLPKRTTNFQSLLRFWFADEKGLCIESIPDNTKSHQYEKELQDIFKKFHEF